MINFKKLKRTRVEYFYFYLNLFMPFEGSTILKDTKLSKRTIEKLLNEIFSLHRQRNEEEIEKFAKEKDIKRL